MIVTDYSVGNHNLVYSTADIFTWKKLKDITVLILYGSEGEYHELGVSFSTSSPVKVLDGSASKVSSKHANGMIVVGMHVDSPRSMVQIDDLLIIMLGTDSLFSLHSRPSLYT